MTRWQVRFDEDEAVFRRPLTERLLFGLLAIGSAYLLGGFLVFAYHQGASGKDMLPLGIVMFLAVVSIFLFAAGPKEMRFDSKRQRYRWRMGFPLLSWTHTGDFSEIKSLSVWNLTKFTGLGVEWKNSKRTAITFVECSTGSEAQALAEHLGKKVGVPAEKGVVRGLKKPSRLQR
jgi:hypothetical protein